MSDGRMCGEFNAQGGPCRARPQVGRELCYMHDPDNADKVRAAREVGGRHRARRAVLTESFDFPGFGSLGSCREFLESIALGVIGDDIPLPKARVLARLTEVAIRVRELESVEALFAAEVNLSRAAKQSHR